MPASAERLLDVEVAAAAVGAVVGGDVHPARADLAARPSTHLAHRVAAHDGQPAVPLPEGGVERAQRPAEVPPARDAGRSPQRRVEHEQRQHAVGVAGVEQGRVVGEAQVAAEPHHGCRVGTSPTLPAPRTRHSRRGPIGQNGQVSDLIDTTEMYLRTIYELVEEGIVPLRARIAERLHQSGPTVSQTVARMERDGLLTVEGDRHLELTEQGTRLAVRVMRKHRLAERLLTDVIGLEWELVHAEACRWEHVMSETVERRLVELLGHPTESPYGNPIPGLAELGETSDGEAFMTGVEPLDVVAKGADETRVLVRRIGEEMQKDEAGDGRAAPGRRAARQGRHRGRRRRGRADRQRRRDRRDRRRARRAPVRAPPLTPPAGRDPGWSSLSRPRLVELLCLRPRLVEPVETPPVCLD